MRCNLNIHNTRRSRNPGRRDGFLWNARAFICPAEVDGFRRDVRDPAAACDYLDVDQLDAVDSQPTRASRHEVAILEIARHAKLKGSSLLHLQHPHTHNSPGVAKEFEVLEAPRRIIALDADADVFLDGSQSMEDDAWEWENISELDLESDTPAQGPDTDYLIARRLQDEEAHQRKSGTRRKTYADVLRTSTAATRRTPMARRFSPAVPTKKERQLERELTKVREELVAKEEKLERVQQALVKARIAFTTFRQEKTN
ncbi:hypothetical protein B0H17DRAFT_1140881 [Mycena rosella]|uniref:Uncharacterized protein n=1 Tax=Mycena rosella TaxID=1033263 RepID=A0AAD7D4T8_MYCRO|nr:hypothetical protein B0H17DRAFT_1140881 [Mycena rosella]